MDSRTFLDLALLLEYPDAARHTELTAALTRLTGAGAAGGLTELERLLGAESLGELQESYTKSFDSRQDTALEVGWHLFGESYARGALLVELRDLLRRAGVDEGRELPDFLPTLLRLCPRLDEATRRRLLEQRILPAARRIATTLGVEDSPYAPLFDLLIECCAQAAGGAQLEGCPA